MPKVIIVAGYHRNAELAERNLARLVKQHKAKEGRIYARRNDRGNFSARGRHFTFALIPKSKRKRKTKKLYRLTIGITYPGHSKKANRDDYLGYSLQHWQGSASFSKTRREDLKEIVIQGLEKHLEYPRGKFWFDLESAIGIETPSVVFEDPKLKGTYELSADEEGEGTGRFDTLEGLREFVEEDEPE